MYNTLYVCRRYLAHNMCILLTERQAKNTEDDIDEVEKAAVVENSTERSISVKEHLATEDAEPAEDSAMADSEDDAVVKEVGARNWILLLCLTVLGVYNNYAGK